MSGAGAFRRAGGAALAVLLLCLQGCNPSQGGDTHAAQARIAQEEQARLEGAACIAAQATPEQKAPIARMLVINTLAPKGALPAWLPDSFDMSVQGISGSDAWNLLQKQCPAAPAFGTPFGFPSAKIEQALRTDPVFAALLDQQWAEVKGYQARAARPS